MKKYIKIETGSYRGNDMSGRIFPIIKDYQKFTGGKEGGFVTVDCSEFDGFEGLDKARVNVPDIGSLTIVPEGQYISHRDELKKTDKKMWKKLTRTVRDDGAWIDAGENDNLMVSKLVANPDAVGVFGYSFLDQNSDKIKGAVVNGTQPTFENIAGGKYKISRSLFFYIKHAHVGTVPGIQEFVAEFTSEKAFGEEGYLVPKGLIPLPSTDRATQRTNSSSLTKLAL